MLQWSINNILETNKDTESQQYSGKPQEKLTKHKGAYNRNCGAEECNKFVFIVDTEAEWEGLFSGLQTQMLKIIQFKRQNLCLTIADGEIWWKNKGTEISEDCSNIIEGLRSI